MAYRKLIREERWIVKGTPFLFLVGGLWHMLYEFTGKSYLIGLIAAVNESIWEHSKMVLIPAICWWSIFYVIKGKSYGIDRNKWFTGGYSHPLELNIYLKSLTHAPGFLHGTARTMGTGPAPALCRYGSGTFR